MCKLKEFSPKEKALLIKWNYILLRESRKQQQQQLCSQNQTKTKAWTAIELSIINIYIYTHHIWKKYGKTTTNQESTLYKTFYSTPLLLKTFSISFFCKLYKTIVTKPHSHKQFTNCDRISSKKPTSLMLIPSSSVPATLCRKA